MSMREAIDGIIFSDLDGTFLDNAYQPALLRDELAAVRQRWLVVWTSSRTADELAHLAPVTGLAGDAICENGAVVLCAERACAEALGEASAFGARWIARLGAPVEDVRFLVRSVLQRHGVSLRTMDELGVDVLARRSGYGIADARRALARRASVLLVDVDSADESTSAALDELRALGCTVVHGGRWTSVVRGADKGNTARAYASYVDPLHTVPIIAIGNADNDETLLRQADVAFVVRDAVRGHALRLSAVPHATLLQEPGTAGWREMLDLLASRAEHST